MLNQLLFWRYRKLDLLLYDDIYPHPVSGFRYEELTVLLTEFKSSKIILNPISYGLVNTLKENHKNHVADIVKKNRLLKGKLICKGRKYYRSKLFYCVFLHNILSNLSWLEELKIPFVFTLYPGGGFQVGDKKVDESLRKVFESPMFRKVIVTQPLTRDYLIKKKLCSLERIMFVFGCVVPQQSLLERALVRKNYLINKDTFDICFCAAKYTPLGKDKGYDVFVKFAHQISTKYDFLRFHVIGGFDKEDIAIDGIEEKISFYGYKNFDGLKSIFRSMDVIVSPNKPFVLRPGAFDGFPLGTVVEAVSNGVVALVTDELKQNAVFKNNEELIIVKGESIAIEREIIKLINYPEKLYLISKKGREKFLKVYSNERQIKPRIELLKREIYNC
ncbi:glycosyltransferase family 4 protein [Snuella lapsa]|uniref:glycosyltransferase family 4 protein n=1 Tax=Snuella lapsa TaxID=870481 RepID=UPI0031EE83C4